MTLLDLAEAKAQLNITGTDNDEELQAYVDATTAVVERLTGRVIEPRDCTTITRAARGAVILAPVPVLGVTAVSVDGRALSADQLSALVLDGSSGLLAGDMLAGFVEVDFTAGMSTVPPAYALAARIILQHLYETQRGRWGPVRAGVDVTTPPGFGYAVPNRALELLGTGLAGVA